MAPKRKRLSFLKKGGSSVGQGAGRGAGQKASDDPFDFDPFDDPSDTNYIPRDEKPRPARSQNARCELDIDPAVAVSIPTNKRNGKRKSMGDAPGAASGGCTVARMSTKKTPAKEGKPPPATSNGATKTLFSCENSNIVDLARDPVAPVTYKDTDHVDVDAPKDSDDLIVSDTDHVDVDAPKDSDDPIVSDTDHVDVDAPKDSDGLKVPDTDHVDVNAPKDSDGLKVPDTDHVDVDAPKDSDGLIVSDTDHVDVDAPKDSDGLKVPDTDHVDVDAPKDSDGLKVPDTDHVDVDAPKDSDGLKVPDTDHMDVDAPKDSDGLKVPDTDHMDVDAPKDSDGLKVPDTDHVDVDAPKDSDGLIVSLVEREWESVEKVLHEKVVAYCKEDYAIEFRKFVAKVFPANEISDLPTLATAMDLQDCKKRIQELEVELKGLKFENSRLKAKLQMLSLMETSGSYSDGDASPTMLGTACLNIYEAIMKLGKILAEFEPPVMGCCCCCESNCQRAWQDLQQILSRISPADVPIDPNRAIQARHTWGHWISSKFFVGFETVSFDVYDEHEKITPLNLRTQAVERFQRYLQQKDMSAADKLYVEDRRFRVFCHQKYQTVFPSDIVLQALHPQYSGKREISRDKYGRFAGDKQIFLQFVEVAKAVWLLHHLSLSFDPPASILRMGQVTLFDQRYHTPVVSDGESDNQSLQQAIAFVITPALRVGKSIIKSRVYLLEG